MHIIIILTYSRQVIWKLRFVNNRNCRNAFGGFDCIKICFGLIRVLIPFGKIISKIERLFRIFELIYQKLVSKIYANCKQKLQLFSNIFARFLYDSAKKSIPIDFT